MKYFVSRDGREYGPYTIEELRDYIAQGRVGLTEPAREARDGGRSFATVSEILAAAEIAAAPAPPAPSMTPAQPSYSGSSAPAAGASPYAAPATWQALDGAQPAARSGAPTIPMPSDMHWAVLLLLGVVTCGIFLIVRMFQQAAYGKKVDPANQTTLFYGLYIGLALLRGFIDGFGANQANSGFGILIGLVAFVLVEVGHFKLRDSLQTAFGRPLGPVMTFFFAPFYFQYHMRQVALAMKEGRSF
jgi:hypothetical protein